MVPIPSRLSVNEDETACELASEFLFGRPVKKGEPGTTIEFIGPEGEVVKTVQGTTAKCEGQGSLPSGQGYPPGEKGQDGSLREYYAWTQPVFTDGR